MILHISYICGQHMRYIARHIRPELRSGKLPIVYKMFVLNEGYIHRYVYSVMHFFRGLRLFILIIKLFALYKFKKQ